MNIKKFAILWYTLPCSLQGSCQCFWKTFRTENGYTGSKSLWKTGKYLRTYTALQHNR